MEQLALVLQPHTAKLEPIQSDVNVSPAKHSLMMKPPSHGFLLSKQMLEDKEVWKHYDLPLILWVTYSLTALSSCT